MGLAQRLLGFALNRYRISLLRNMERHTCVVCSHVSSLLPPTWFTSCEPPFCLSLQPSASVTVCLSDGQLWPYSPREPASVDYDINR
jgi:hypothetical protein